MISRGRLNVIAAVLAVWAGLTWARLAQVQVLEHDRWEALAARQRETTVEIDEPRGDIVSRDGRILAGSVERVNVYANPGRIPRESWPQLAADLASIVGSSRDAILARFAERDRFFYLARNLDPSVEDAVDRLGQRDLGVLPVEQRVYPHGHLAASVVGFVNADGEGQAGLESSYDRTLTGTASVYRLWRDGKTLPLDLQLETAGRAGLSLHLTLDSRAQLVVEEELRRTLATIGGSAASAVVMVPATGEILAMASAPGFDPARPGDSPSRAWRNRTVQDALEPGSTFKPFVVAGALGDGTVSPAKMIDCSGGGIQVASAFIRDHEQYGWLSVRNILVHSSNVGAIRVAHTLSPVQLDATIRSFGFGSRTGIELPAETGGLYRSLDRWSGLSRAGLAIGQEISVSPLQLARGYAVFANGGRLVRPVLVSETRDRTGDVVAPRRFGVPRRVLDPSIAAQVTRMLEGVVAEGTGKRAAVVGYRVAGKTGTAQKAVDGGYQAGKHLAWFAGFLPLPDPQLVIVVCVDEPHTNFWASDVAAPTFARIASRLVTILGIPPERGTRS